MDIYGTDAKVNRKTRKKLVIESINPVAGPLHIEHWLRITNPGKYIQSVIPSLEAACEHWNNGLASSAYIDCAPERLALARRCGAKLRIVTETLDEPDEK